MERFKIKENPVSEGQMSLVEKPQANGQSVLRLLVLEESASEAQALIDPLRDAGYAVTAARAKTPLEFQVALKKQEWDIILSPLDVAGFTAKQALALLKHAKLDIPLVILCEQIDDRELTEALRNGARALLNKRNIEQLQMVVDRELRDLTQRRARQYYERMFRESERRCQSLLETSRNAIACVRAGKIIYNNPSFNALAGKQPDGGAASLNTLIHRDDQPAFLELIKEINHQQIGNKQLELRIQSADGREFKTTVEAASAHVNGQQCVQLTITLADEVCGLAVTVAPAAAPRDPLGLVSAGDFISGLDGLLQAAPRPSVTLAYLEIDEFDKLKQSAGNAELETIIRDIAAVIVKHAGKDVTVSHNSAQTFTLLFSKLTAKQTAKIAQAICQDLAQQSWQRNGQPITATCSIGVSSPDADVKKSVSALADADTACQLAKQAGGNRVQIADPALNSAVSDDKALAARQHLRDALAANRFRLVYQPIVNLHGGPFQCYDVLMRMLDEQGKELMPADFMPTAEKAGLMPALDRWVIAATLQVLVKQRASGKETSFIVKLSEDSLNDQTLTPWLGKQLQELQLPGDTLIFEIKEASAARHPAAAKQLMQNLKQLRCRTALGHFGTDPRSLEYLDQLRADFVKLAGSFVDKLSGGAKEEMMIKTVVQAAHDLGTLTIATFVQEASKMTTLWQCQVDYIVGFFLQVPDEDLSYNFDENE